MYEKNLEIITQNSSTYLQDIIKKSQMEKLDSIDFQKNLYKKNGKKINSEYDPNYEAKLLCDSYNIDSEQQGLIVVHDFKIGFEIEEIIKQNKNIRLLLIIIYDVQLLKEVMYLKDLSFLRETNVVILSDGDIGLIKELGLELLKSSYKMAIIDNLFDYKYEEKMNLINKTIVEIIYHNRVLVGNDINDTLIGIYSTLRNIDFMAKSPEIISKSKLGPALCIAAGPSLNDELDLIKDISSNVPIFIVDTVMDLFREKEIPFDYVSTIERTELPYTAFYEEKKLENNVVFIGSDVVSPNIVNQHEGKNLVLYRKNTLTSRLMSEVLESDNTRNYGSSCAHLSIAAADHMGYSPIILVGQDLSYGLSGDDHVKGTVYDTGEKVTFDKTKLQHKEVTLISNNDDDVKSTMIWNHFRMELEKYIRDYSPSIINTSLNGAKIQGSEYLSLESALNKYVDRSSGKQTADILEMNDENISSRYKKISNYYIDLCHEIDEMIIHSIKIKDIIFGTSESDIYSISDTSEIMNYLNHFLNFNIFSAVFQSETISLLRLQSKQRKLDYEFAQKVENFTDIVLFVLDKMKNDLQEIGVNDGEI